jgi:flagellar hook-associated protein 1 FlgK
MSLSVALNTARSSLLATSTQVSVSGKNIAGADDPAYSRKLAITTTTADGGARIISITRASDMALYFRMLGATSSAAGQQALQNGLDRLASTIGDPDLEQSPAATLGALKAAIQLAANRPDDMALAQGVVTQAQDIAASLAEASRTVMNVRTDADADMATSVARIKDLLARFETLNTAVVRGTIAGTDITDPLDQRDSILAQLSEELGVTVVGRANNDVALYTDSGVTLFDKTARAVAFAPTPVYAAGTTGNAVYIDGVPVTGANATMPLHSGNLVGLATLRDEHAVSYQNQLDEIARGLVASFAESDQSGGGGPDLAGLFTWSGGPAIPAVGTVVPGLAGQLRVNPQVDPAQGGLLSRLRDGGMNGAAYGYNTTGAAAFAGRLESLVAGMTAAQSYDPATGITGSLGLTDFGASSVSWLEGLRQAATTDAGYQTTLLARASEALSNATGVNMDEEYAIQLQLEKSYAASSKLIGVINQLFDTLLGAVG